MLILYLLKLVLERNLKRLFWPNSRKTKPMAIVVVISQNISHLLLSQNKCSIRKFEIWNFTRTLIFPLICSFGISNARWPCSAMIFKILPFPVNICYIGNFGKNVNLSGGILKFLDLLVGFSVSQRWSKRS